VLWVNSAPGPLDRLELVRTSPRGLKLPGHVLRREAAPADFDAIPHPERVLLAEQLLATMHRERGIGLAAPMVGIGLRAIVAIDGETPHVMFNPRVESVDERTDSSREANLCLPGLSAEVERPTGVTISWQDVEGANHRDSFTGLLARTLQHELEVLDGGVFIDVAKKETIRSTSPESRAAAATSYLFEKPAPKVEAPPGIGRQGCVTLPPPLGGIEQSVLRRPADPVRLDRFKRNQLRELVEAMFQLQYEQGGVGLAAPQIGLGLRLAVIDDWEEPLVLINPEVLEREGEEEVSPERCLSIPGWEGAVPRAPRIVLRNTSLNGTSYKLKAEGHRARIIQHECDHLDGILYTDRMASSEALTRSDPEALARKAVNPAAAAPSPP